VLEKPFSFELTAFFSHRRNPATPPSCDRRAIALLELIKVASD
jgi:hypothetical protein